MVSSSAVANEDHVRLLKDGGWAEWRAEFPHITPDLKGADLKGVNIYTLEYDRAFNTANGVIHTASVTLDRVSIDDLELEDVSATISRAPMSISLLGMSFLNRLNGYEVRNDDLILRW